MNIKYYLSIVCFSLLFASCAEEFETQEYSSSGTLKVADPYLQINTPVVSFQAGNKDYTIDFNVVNGLNKVSKVNVYKQFTDAKTGNSSSVVLQGTYDVADADIVSVVKKLTYADLKNGITVSGAALPDEKDLAVGSSWKLTFEGETSLGKLPLAGSMTVGVLSRFAGIYRIVEFSYYRIGVNTALAEYYVGAQRFIGSVDENTFSYNDYWGGFAWGGNSFRFDIDFANNKVTVPILVSGALFSGNRALNCATDAAEMKFVPCEGSNVLIKDDANGKHVIKLTYGYFSNGSGPREFYEVLEKVVN
jgi:hypothetical protein